MDNSKINLGKYNKLIEIFLNNRLLVFLSFAILRSPTFFQTIEIIDKTLIILKVGVSLVIITLFFIHIFTKGISKIFMLISGYYLWVFIRTVQENGNIQGVIVLAASTLVLSALVILCLEYKIERLFDSLLLWLEICIAVNFIITIFYPGGIYFRPGIDFLRENYFLGYDNQNINWFMPALLLSAINMLKTNKKARFLGVLALSLATSIWVWSAGTLIQICLICVLLLAYKFFSKIDISIFFISNIVLYISVVFLRVNEKLSFIFETLLNKSADLTGRTTIWDATLTHIRHNIIIGHGFENYEFRVQKMTSLGTPYFAGINAHSRPLEVLYEGGLIALILFLAIITIAVVSLKRNKNHKEAYIATFCLFSYFVGMITEVYPYSLLFFPILIMCTYIDKLEMFNKNSISENKFICGDDLLKLQEIELDLLSSFDNICQRAGIKYTLLEGSALGAVRHKGMIPWDDDIDVGILREDFEKFKENCTTLPDNIEYQDYNTNADYSLPFSRLYAKNTLFLKDETKHLDHSHGVYLDIFILDKVANSSIKRYIQQREHKFWSRVLRFKINKYNNFTGVKKIIKNCMIFISSFISKDFIVKRLEKNCEKYQHLSCEYLSNLSSEYTGKALIHVKEFDGIKKCKFSEIESSIISNPENYLTRIYGDYMTLPPIEERTNKHSVIDYDFEGWNCI